MYRVNFFQLSNKVILMKTYFEAHNWNKMSMFHCVSMNERPQETFFHILSGCDYPNIHEK